jgi:hypothetical protein
VRRGRDAHILRGLKDQAGPRARSQSRLAAPSRPEQRSISARSIVRSLPGWTRRRSGRQTRAWHARGVAPAVPAGQPVALRLRARLPVEELALRGGEVGLHQGAQMLARGVQRT